MLSAIVNGQINLEEPEEWVVIWETGLLPCITPGMQSGELAGTREAGMDDAGVVNIPKGTKVKVIAHYVPVGKSPSQELWGLIMDEKAWTYWVALVLNTQPRAEFILPDVKNEIMLHIKLSNGRWQVMLHGYHKNVPFFFQW